MAIDAIRSSIALKASAVNVNMDGGHTGMRNKNGSNEAKHVSNAISNRRRGGVKVGKRLEMGRKLRGARSASY